MAPLPTLTSGYPLRAAIVGLGQAGSRFDEEPGRTTVWSHAGAYLALAERFALCAAVEPSPANATAFHIRCPHVPVVGSVTELVERFCPEVASICTPAETHAAVLHELVKSRDLRLVWCEKPLSTRLEDAQEMVAVCKDRGIKLMVSYNRHWLPLWFRTCELLRGNVVGTVRSVRVAMPNRLFSIGSHAVDLAIMLGGPVESIAILPLPALEETGEPAIPALLRYRSGAGGIVQVTGLKQQLVVEAEIFGDDGRLLAREDTGDINIERFETSRHYQGYRQLGTLKTEAVGNRADFSPFIAMANNAAAAVTTNAPLACDGQTALEVQHALDLMVASNG